MHIHLILILMCSGRDAFRHGVHVFRLLRFDLGVAVRILSISSDMVYVELGDINEF